MEYDIRLTNSPGFVVECFKITYKFDYFKLLAERLINAGWPEIQPNTQNYGELMVALHGAFSINKVENAIDDWQESDILLFLEIFKRTFGDNTLLQYPPVDAFFKKLESRYLQIRSTTTDGVRSVVDFPTTPK